MSYRVQVLTKYNSGRISNSDMEISKFMKEIQADISRRYDAWFDSEDPWYKATSHYRIMRAKFDKETGNLQFVEIHEEIV